MPRHSGKANRTDAADDQGSWESYESNKIKVGFTDAHGTPLALEQRVRFHSSKGTVMRGRVVQGVNTGRLIKIHIDGDPFPSMVDHRQLEVAADNEPFTPRRRNVQMTKTATPTLREIRNKAKNMQITGWEEMSKEELIAATSGDEEVAEAPAKTKRSKAASKTIEKPAPKAKATKTSTRAAKGTKTTEKAAPKPRAAAAKPEGPNPFEPGSNLYHITEALMVGGKRSALVKKLLPKLKYNPRVKSSEEFDPVAETDRRLKVVGYILKNQHGFEYSNEGRGSDSVIKVTPPGASSNGTKLAKATPAAKAAKKVPAKTTARTASSKRKAK